MIKLRIYFVFKLEYFVSSFISYGNGKICMTYCNYSHLYTNLRIGIILHYFNFKSFALVQIIFHYFKVFLRILEYYFHENRNS